MLSCAGWRWSRRGTGAGELRLPGSDRYGLTHKETGPMDKEMETMLIRQPHSPRGTPGKWPTSCFSRRMKRAM